MPKKLPARMTRFRGGPAGSKDARRREKQRIERQARKERAYAMYFGEGKTIYEIAAELKVSSYTASVDVREARQQAIEHDAERLWLMRERMGERIERITSRALRKSRPDDRLALQAMAQESKLYGLDLRPTDTFTAEQVIGLMRGVTALFLETVPDEALRRQFALGLKRRMGAIAGEVVEQAKAEPEGGAA